MLNKKLITYPEAIQMNLSKIEPSKQNKICVERGCEFYNRAVKSYLPGYKIEMYPNAMPGSLLLLEHVIKL